MRSGMSMKVSRPDKKTVSGGEERTKTGRGLWATSLVRPGFLWTGGLTARAQESRVSAVQQRTRTRQRALTHQERRLVFWEPVLQRQRLCQILHGRREVLDQ